MAAAMLQKTLQALRVAGVAASLAVAAASAQAPLDVRLALVIGNSAYADAPLVNPANDALAVGEALRKLGFTVRILHNAEKSQMAQAFDTLNGELKGRQGLAMIYFAGHGVQVDNDNFIIPVDARIRQEPDIATQGIDINRVMASMAASGNRLSVLVLDACRDNPFRTRKDFAGLAPIDAPKGSLMAYATEPGNVAQDGDSTSGNGLYTRFLLKELSRPGATIDDVFKRVRFAVRKASNGLQIPSYSNGLAEDFSLDKGFNFKAPDMAGRAAQFALEKTHWDTIKGSRNPDDFYGFIEAFPNSAIGELAQAELEKLARRKILAQAAPGEIQQHPGDSRFRVGDSYRMQVTLGTGRPQDITVKVTGVNDDKARYTDVFGVGQIGESTISGAVISDGISTYDPPYVLVPGGEYQVGKRWSGRSIRAYNTGRKEWMDYSARVVAREKVTVPAGSFDAYKVEISFQMQSGSLQKSVTWVQPEWGIAVKALFQFQDSSGTLRPGSREMLDRQRGS